MLSRCEKVLVAVLLFANIFLFCCVLQKFFIHKFVPIPIEPVIVSELISCDEDILLTAYEEELNCIPMPILQSFQMNDWTFEVSNETIPSLADQFTNPIGITGITDYKNKLISVSDPDAVIHEFGHYFWFMLQDPDGVETLYDMESTHAQEVLGPYSATNSREYFAEYFKFFMMEPDSAENLAILKLASPNTFQYMIDMLAARQIVLPGVSCN